MATKLMSTGGGLLAFIRDSPVEVDQRPTGGGMEGGVHEGAGGGGGGLGGSVWGVQVGRGGGGIGSPYLPLPSI